MNMHKTILEGGGGKLGWLILCCYGEGNRWRLGKIWANPFFICLDARKNEVFVVNSKGNELQSFCSY